MKTIQNIPLRYHRDIKLPRNTDKLGEFIVKNPSKKFDLPRSICLTWRDIIEIYKQGENLTLIIRLEYGAQNDVILTLVNGILTSAESIGRFLPFANYPEYCYMS